VWIITWSCLTTSLNVAEIVAKILPGPEAPRSPIYMMGSKATIAPWVVRHFPKHRVYCEPFGGAASLLLAKDPSPVEIYNDINVYMVNFFTVLRDRSQELIGRLAFAPAARLPYETILFQWKERGPPTDPLTQAYEWFILASQSFSGHLGTGWAHSRQGQSAARRWINAVDRLYAAAERLQLVQIESGPWEKVVKLYDGEDTLFYVDPPYVMTTDPYPQTPKWTWQNYASLLRTLSQVKAKVALSTYPNQIHQTLIPTWKWDSLAVTKTSEGVTAANPIKTRQLATELLLMNF